MTALAGTAPAQRTVAFASCVVSDEARRAVDDVLRSGWTTTGPRTAEFESAFAELVRAGQAVAVSSCTAAIELSLRALRLPAGSPVLTPTLTFCGAVQAIMHAGLRPVLLDTDPATLLVDPDVVARAARRDRPAAMVVQHMAGYPADVPILAEAAGLPRRRVVEDAAHALGATRAGVPVGGGPGLSCFSFYATKNLPLGEGGAITTDDPDLADELRETRQHGMSRNAWARYLPGGATWKYDVERPGLKANFTDIQAAMGLGQLERFAEWQDRRARIADRYDNGLRGMDGIDLPPRPAAGHAWHLYVVRVDARRFGMSRDELVRHLGERGIGTSVHFIPVHRLTYFRQALDVDPTQFPVAEQLADRIVSLPMHPALTDADIDYVLDQITHPRNDGR